MTNMEFMRCPLCKCIVNVIIDGTEIFSDEPQAHTQYHIDRGEME